MKKKNFFLFAKVLLAFFLLFTIATFVFYRLNWQVAFFISAFVSSALLVVFALFFSYRMYLYTRKMNEKSIRRYATGEGNEFVKDEPEFTWHPHEHTH